MSTSLSVSRSQRTGFQLETCLFKGIVSGGKKKDLGVLGGLSL